MKKLMFWVGFAIPFLHINAIFMLDSLEGTLTEFNVASTIALGLMLYSRQWSMITLLAIISAIYPTIGSLYIPMSLEIAVRH